MIHFHKCLPSPRERMKTITTKRSVWHIQFLRYLLRKHMKYSGERRVEDVFFHAPVTKASGREQQTIIAIQGTAPASSSWIYYCWLTLDVFVLLMEMLRNFVQPTRTFFLFFCLRRRQLPLLVVLVLLVHQHRNDHHHHGQHRTAATAGSTS